MVKLTIKVFMIFQNLKKNERKYEKWIVSGDLEYMRTAESFSLSNRLADYSSQRNNYSSAYRL